MAVNTDTLNAPEDFHPMSEMEEDYHLLLLAQERLANGNIQNAIPLEMVMNNLGITQADLDAAEELEIETVCKEAAKRRAKYGI